MLSLNCTFLFSLYGYDFKNMKWHAHILPYFLAENEIFVANERFATLKLQTLFGNNFQMA